MNMSLMLNLQQRMVTIQELGLESEYLQSALVRSEKLLKTTQGQKAAGLLEELYPAEGYRSVQDWLVGSLVPSMNEHIQDFYHRDGEKLMAGFSWKFIDLLDKSLATALVALMALENELWTRAIRKEHADREALVQIVLDEHILPCFPVVPARAAVA
jgi:hypothetical protein